MSGREQWESFSFDWTVPVYTWYLSRTFGGDSSNIFPVGSYGWTWWASFEGVNEPNPNQKIYSIMIGIEPDQTVVTTLTEPLKMPGSWQFV